MISTRITLIMINLRLINTTTNKMEKISMMSLNLTLHRTAHITTRRESMNLMRMILKRKMKQMISITGKRGERLRV
jgi:hypothetical protein